MKPSELLDFLSVIEKLKCNTRHSYTTSGRHESVAEHSWRLATMAMLMRDELGDADNDRLIKMCLIHDFGEAITGDIPCFDKTQKNEKTELDAIDSLLDTLPSKEGNELKALFSEINESKTYESKLLHALDKLEAVISHNEADISTWIPLEYQLNQVYGKEECEVNDYLKELRALCRQNSINKINNNR